MFMLADGSVGMVWKLTPTEIEGKARKPKRLVSQWENFLTRIPNERLACQLILTSDRNTNPQLHKYLDHTEVFKAQEFAQGKAFYKSSYFTAKGINLYATVRYFPDWSKTKFWKEPIIKEETRRHQKDFLKYVVMVEGVFYICGSRI